LIFRVNQKRFVAPVTHPFDAAVWVDVVPVSVRHWFHRFVFLLQVVFDTEANADQLLFRHGLPDDPAKQLVSDVLV
jgi:hypothetical protein